MNFKNSIIFLIVATIITSCGSYFNQPVMQEEARTGEVTPNTEKLKKLPLPMVPVVVGVYNFKDQTGQYKQVELGNSFSTAVSQGGTTMLIKALEDSKWFTPIERENLANLLNERNIIRSTRKEYQKNSDNNEPKLPPLLYAGVLLEGGIVSYDTNIITGGMGARYFGVGASTQYREDRLTVYLRAVSTSNGKVLKTIYVSKTILSQAVDASLFRYVNFQRLLEVEMGYTKNEPVQLALKDAIEKAVEGLIIEGIQDELWSAKEGEMTNNLLVKEYLEEKEMEESKLLYNRTQTERDYSNTFSFSLNTPLLYGDLTKKRLGYGATLGYSRKLTNYINLNLSGTFLNLRTGSTFSENYIDLSLNAEGVILPYDNLTPYVYGGLGYLLPLGKSDESLAEFKPSLKIQGGIGIMYYISQTMAIKAFAESNLIFSDTVEYVENGKRDDYYLNFGIGINYSFGRKKIKNKIINPELNNQ
tara:strand:+ start:24795 stop:26216 length:1422 start_codon:yes stop_codon:yes gene_type:complete